MLHIAKSKMSCSVLSKLVLVGVSLSLGGCANMTHFNRSKDIRPASNQAQTVFIDAKQRAIITAAPTPAVSNEGSIRTCAEPSPDALSAIAASQGIGLNTNGVDLSQALSIAESGGSIGLRTQSIQLMRDEMYRTCEMYLSGAISEASWETLHRRSQTLMVAVLAIEQLTGTVKANQIVLGGSSSTGNAAAVVELTTMTETARTGMNDAEKARDDAKKLSDAAGVAVLEKEAAFKAATDEAAKTKAKADLDTAKANANTKLATLNEKEQLFSNKKDAFESVNRSRMAALNGQTTSSGSGQFSSESGGSRIDNATAATMATAVNLIVTNTLQQSYGREICTTALNLLVANKLPADNPVAKQCLDLLKSSPPPFLIPANLTSVTLSNAYLTGKLDPASLNLVSTTLPPRKRARRN